MLSFVYVFASPYTASSSLSPSFVRFKAPGCLCCNQHTSRNIFSTGPRTGPLLSSSSLFHVHYDHPVFLFLEFHDQDTLLRPPQHRKGYIHIRNAGRLKPKKKRRKRPQKSASFFFKTNSLDKFRLSPLNIYGLLRRHSRSQ